MACSTTFLNVKFCQKQNEIKTFYTNLYSGKSIKTEKDCLNYLSSINTPKLWEVDKLSCEGKCECVNDFNVEFKVSRKLWIFQGVLSLLFGELGSYMEIHLIFHFIKVR